MEKTWATSGLDLHLELRGSRKRAALEAALRDAIRSGRLAGGAWLPSSRALARDLGVARNTVAEAYGQLVAEGWLVTRQGSGTRVGQSAGAVGNSASRPAEEGPRPRHDLRPGTPDLAAFPRSRWLAGMRRVLSEAPDESLGYGDPRGRPELRSALVDYLARARGVRTDPARVVVCSGFTQGLAVLCEVLRRRGAVRMAVEGYSQPRHRDLITAQGLALDPVCVDRQGAVIDELGAPDAVLLTPAHQFPLGVSLAPARRTAAVDWALERTGVIIEDDYDGEFRYDRHPVGAMQALAPERVVYAGTASKALAPGLRLGWLVLPGDLVDDVVAAKARADWHTSALDQLILAEMIRAGAYDRHVRRVRLAYRRRRDRLIASLRRGAPDARITGIAAGLHALIELPDGMLETDVVRDAGEAGLALEGLAAYRAGRFRHAPALVIGYATPPDHAFTASLARLTAVLAKA